MSVLPNLNSIKVGLKIIYNEEPYLVVEANFVRMQQRKPVMQTKMKNLMTGRMLEYNFKPGDKVETADLGRKKVSFLYADETGSHFMENETYEQITLDASLTENKVGYLREGSEVQILYFNDEPIDIELPIKMDFTVTSAPPGVKGDTAQGKVTKPVEIETGATINAPLFINEGDKIRVNTETGEYVERVTE